MIPFILIVIMVVAIVYFFYNDHQKGKLMLEQEQERKEAEEQARLNVLKHEALLQAQMVGDVNAIKALENGTYNGPLPEKENGRYNSIFDGLLILPIAGINYRSGIKTYVGDFKGVLVPEPKNDYDPNAIMIKCEDGHHLGYVPEEETDSVRMILGRDFQRHRIIGHIDELEDEDDEGNTRKFFSGHIYIAK